MNDNVISLKSGKPLVQTEEDERLAEEKAKAEQVAFMLQELDKIRNLVATGRIEALIVTGRDVETDLFIADVICGPVVSPAQAIRYLGHLEMLKLEMSELASMTPVLMTDGQKLDPNDDTIDIADDDE
jgi:hypothetical protein